MEPVPRTNFPYDLVKHDDLQERWRTALSCSACSRRLTSSLTPHEQPKTAARTHLRLLGVTMSKHQDERLASWDSGTSYACH